MANFSTTYSGDFTSYVAGKIFSAANMAKDEKERRKEEGLNQAQPGSLFGRALQHEFGGDLYNRTFGIFDPRKKHDETDRKSSKEARFTAQFPKSEKNEEKSTEKKNVKSAKQGLLAEDNDSVPVKDKDLRQQISKIFGAGIDARLIASEHKLSRVTQNIVEVKQGLVETQQLVIDQNTILLSKFDQILEIFGKQAEFQEKLKDKAEAAEKERIIEEQKDLSSTRGLIDTGAMTGGTSVPSRIARFYKNRAIRRLYRKLPKSVRQTRTTVRNIQRIPGKAVGRISNSAASKIGRILPAKAANFGKNIASARSAAQGMGGVSKIKSVGKNVPGLKQALAVWEYGDRKSAGQSNLQATVGVGGGLAGAAAGAAIGTMLFPGVGTLAGLLIGAAFSAAGGYAGAKIADTVTGVHETGTSLTKKGTGLLHGKELILGTDDRKGIKNAFVDSMDKMGSQLVSTAVTLGESAGQGRQIRSEAKKLGLDYKIIPISLKTDIGKSNQTKPDTKLLAGIINPFSALQDQIERQRGDGTTPTDTPTITPLSTDQAEAFEKIRKIAEKVGSPKPEVTAAIAMLESGWLANPDSVYFASGKTNPFGQTGRGPKGFVIGKDGQEHAVYNSLEEGVKAHVDRWKSSYIGKTDQEIIESIRTGAGVGAPGQYNTRPGWTQDVMRVLQSSRVQVSSLSIPSGVRIDATGEPGVDFTPSGNNNLVVFPGKVIEWGYQYNPDRRGGDGEMGAGYGNYVIIRSSHPQYPNEQFDSLYAHFPLSEVNKYVKAGDNVTSGQVLGLMGTKAHRRSEVGSLTGPHTSLDFLKPGSNEAYSRWRSLVPLVTLAGSPSSTASAGPTPRHQGPVIPGKSKPKPSSIFNWPGSGGGGELSEIKNRTTMLKTRSGGEGGPGAVDRDYNFTPEQRALLKTISYAEGTTKSYGVVYGGNIVPELAQGIMTVREVWNMMKTGRLRGRNAGYDASGESYATGRYQLMPDTLSDLVKAGHVKWSEKMTNQLQDYLALKRLETFRGVSGRDLRQQGLSRGIMSKIAPEFASFPYAPKGGGSFYDQPVKSEKTLQQQYNSALKQILEEQRRQKELREKLRLKKEAQDKNIFNQIQKFLPGGLKGLIPSQLLSDSSIMKYMEDEIPTQFVIINNVVASNTEKSPGNLSSSSGDSDSSSQSIYMAILGEA